MCNMARILKATIGLVLILIIVDCNPTSEKKENEDLTNILLLNQLTSSSSCPTCSCTLPDTASAGPRCFDYVSSTSATTARSHCSTNSGTFSSTAACSTTRNSVGNCSGTIASSGIGVKITYYDYYTSLTNFAAGSNFGITSSTGAAVTLRGVAGKCTDDGITSTQTIVLASASPRIRFTNNSGGSETYSLHTSTSCGAGTKYASIGTVANGATGAYTTITARNASSTISFNDGTTCSAASYLFSNGNVWTITSGTSTYSITATTE